MPFSWLWVKLLSLPACLLPFLSSSLPSSFPPSSLWEKVPCSPLCSQIFYVAKDYRHAPHSTDFMQFWNSAQGSYTEASIQSAEFCAQPTLAFSHSPAGLRSPLQKEWYSLLGCALLLFLSRVNFLNITLQVFLALLGSSDPFCHESIPCCFV